VLQEGRGRGGGDEARLCGVHARDVLKEEEGRKKKGDNGILVCTKLSSAAGGPEVIKVV
jgi:hypothetical protein